MNITYKQKNKEGGKEVTIRKERRAGTQDTPGFGRLLEEALPPVSELDSGVRE